MYAHYILELLPHTLFFSLGRTSSVGGALLLDYATFAK